MDEAHEFLAQRRAPLEAGLVDLRLAGLDDHGVGKPAALEGALAEGPHRTLQAGGRRAVAVDDGRQHIALAARDDGQHLRAQLRLRREVAVDRAGGDAGLLGDGGDLGVAPAALGHQVAGGGQDARALILEADDDGRGAPVDHGWGQGMNQVQMSEPEFIPCGKTQVGARNEKRPPGRRP